jgi:hypothetical protein
MSQRERSNENPAATGGTDPAGGSSANLGELRRAGEDLLAAGDEAIRRALSGDSEAFLRANRQQGGQ